MHHLQRKDQRLHLINTDGLESANSIRPNDLITLEVVIMRHWLPETYNHFGRASELIPSFDKNASDHFVRLRSISVPLLIHIVSRSSLGGEHGERFAFVNDRFATASGGDPKDRH